MESIPVYDQFDFNSFMRRRGLHVIVGMMIVLCIVLAHLYKL
jgi:hypothetical protein